MLRSLSLALALSLFAQLATAAEAIEAPPEPANMKVIFNGTNLSGFDGDPRLWSVSDGVIRGETTKENAAQGNTFLIWKDGTTGDFDLRVSFRSSASNNSGIQYRSKHFESNGKNKWVVKGYQHEIRNEEKLPNVSGFIYGEGMGRGRICLVGEKAIGTAKGKEVTGELITAEEYKELFKVDEWNEVIIRAEGNNLKHYMNGRLVLDFTDNHPELALTTGILALQLHAGAPMWVEFKDLRIKDLK